MPACEQVPQHHRQVARDYWIAVNENAGVMAIYREHRARNRSEDDGKDVEGEGRGDRKGQTNDRDDRDDAWFLHGIYA
ncbi:hypothetical protein ACQ859_08775 [Roseateles chitinivorans]|uniref:hypothetical protein n=1 Tax=Roseateles chitinivorans TaxID=2917965 RepID=UPI003D66B717